jgi:hypothetical protein
MAAAAPDEIVLKRDRDLAGRRWHPYLRRALLGLVALPLILALANVFGQHQSGVSTSGNAATLVVDAPSRARGGLLYTAAFAVRARTELKKATLVLDPGWFDGMQVNSINPQPVDEASRQGRVALDLGHVPAGRLVRYWIEFQVDPTTLGERRQNVELDDGPTRILTQHRTLTIYP